MRSSPSLPGAHPLPQRSACQPHELGTFTIRAGAAPLSARARSGPGGAPRGRWSESSTEATGSVGGEVDSDAAHIWFLAQPLVGEIGAASGEMALIDYLWKRWSGEHDDREHCRRVKRETLAQPGALAAAVSYYRSFVGNGPALAGRLRDPIQVPMLAIYGADDPVPQVLAPGEEAMYSGVYRRADIAGAHHFVHRHDPDEVNRLLVEWFGQGDAHQTPRPAR